MFAFPRLPLEMGDPTAAQPTTCVTECYEEEARYG